MFLRFFRTTRLTLEQLNALAPVEFHKAFENVIECWPEAAVFCSALLPFKSFTTMTNAFENYIERLPTESKLKILRLHPDLAGKLLDTNQLTKESSSEQNAAGLDSLSVEEKTKLTEYNER
ncbi:2-oxo-4-hydroxy-4-carboxy-5-ureidoimidazoline decarboxylase-like, partial [Anopheles cruzii]|uniref:2-oxo-4-hydroxy-4-carboxy-5-ureidoimidazoline decarboxylase-like n=1 Tax=Anopheles cruzii TaxID=68878 RepID=UPI0022EC4C68